MCVHALVRTRVHVYVWGTWKGSECELVEGKEALGLEILPGNWG